MSDISRGSIRVTGFKNEEMDFQLLRQLGATAYRAASIGECLRIANTIQSDPKAWVNEFEKLANWQKEDGLKRLQANHPISGREQLFRACSSFRAAEYYSPCSSAHHRQLGVNSAECFLAAMGTMDIHFETHTLPYKNIHIPVYFISPANDGVKRKTLLIVSGFDGTMEEECFVRGLAGIQRGYNIIHFAGPGQMDVFRHYSKTYFEPDFEEVLKCVLDAYTHRKEIDTDKLALLGISIGGYFATRAASHEPRIKALIANSPILDVHAYLCSFVPLDPCLMPDSQDFTLEQLPAIPDSEFPAELKVRTEQLMIRYGGHSFKKTFEYLKAFQVGRAIEDIRCPTLALIGQGEGGEPRRQFDEFCQKTNSDSYVFNDFEGASNHCQIGNASFANAVMYDWLDDL